MAIDTRYTARRGPDRSWSVYDELRGEDIATGLTMTDWQEAILVNQAGKRFWNELDSSYEFIAAAMAYNGDETKLNGGGPIWA